MADGSLIEWTDATWNPITGCKVVSPGCANCYAMKLAGTRLREHPSRRALTVETKAGPVWNGKVRRNGNWMPIPLRWRRPRRVFVCAHGDLFYEEVRDYWIDEVFAIMALSPQHDFQVLTKRSARMRAYMNDPEVGRRVWREAARIVTQDMRLSPQHPGAAYIAAGEDAAPWPLPNVWLGVSAEDQARADERLTDLLESPAAVRFASLEPLVGPIDLRPWLGNDDDCVECDDGEGWGPRCARRDIPREEQCPRNFGAYRTEEGPADENGVPAWITAHRVRLDWVIVGGESGGSARPMHPVWARQLRDQCAAAGVAFFFKQWGSWREFSHGGPDEEVDADSDLAEAIAADATNPAWLTAEGRLFRSVDAIPEETPARLMEFVGKSAAGRILDGATWSQFPEVRADA